MRGPPRPRAAAARGRGPDAAAGAAGRARAALAGQPHARWSGHPRGACPATRRARSERRRGAPGPAGRSTSCPTCSAPPTTGPASRPGTPWSPRRGVAIPMSASAAPPGRSRRWCRRSSSRRSPARRRSPASARSSSSTASPRPDRARRRAPPAARRRARLASIPSWAWLGLHIDPARSRAVVTAARHADALERIVARARIRPADLDRAIRSLPGLGVWTSAETRQRALGDSDAVSFGDFHVAKDVGWALVGREIDDRELSELLEPWRPQRGRVPLLLGAARIRRPRRGHRESLRGHLPHV